MRDLVIRLPGVATDHTCPKEENYVVLVWLGVNTDEFTRLYVKTGFLKHLTLRRIERRLAMFDASTSTTA